MEPELVVKYVYLKDLVESKSNPKGRSNGDLDDLAASIKSHGVLQPLLVQEDGKGKYEIVAGHRRAAAAKIAGLEAVPVRVIDLNGGAVEALQVATVENIQRLDLTPMQEADALANLTGAADTKSAAAVGAIIGRSARYVLDRIRLLRLSKKAHELLDGRYIELGHAIILARLTPAQQDLALGSLFEHEELLFAPDERYADQMKPRSVKELQAWVDKHVKFDPAGDDVPDLFPETAATITATTEGGGAKLKIVHITHDHQVHPDARDGQRVLGPRSWKRADKKGKACDHAAVGVIMVGPHRGDSFLVCTAKEKCKIHWGEEQRAKAKRAAQADKAGTTGEGRHAKEEMLRKKQEEQRAETRAAFEKARPWIIEAFAARVMKESPRMDGRLAALVITEVERMGSEGMTITASRKLLNLDGSAESVVRLLAWLLLLDHINDYGAPENLPKFGKHFGVDVAKIVKANAGPSEQKVRGREKACSKCGCTQTSPCPQGCAWVTGAKPPLCTACEEKPKAKTKKVKKTAAVPVDGESDVIAHPDQCDSSGGQ